jgi:hypothetical protein
MAIPVGTPDFEAIVLPVFLAVFNIILSNKAFYRQKGRALVDSDRQTNRQVDRKKSRLYRFTSAKQSKQLLGIKRAFLQTLDTLDIVSQR